jgi:hypothetical protein
LNLEPVIDAFNKQIIKEKILLAYASVNEKQIDVTLEFNKKEILFSNLEELPRFTVISRCSQGVYVSNERINWIELNENDSIDLQAYRLFDPTFILPKMEVHAKSEGELTIVDGSYDITDLELPDSIHRWFVDQKNQKRWTRLLLYRNRLISLTQQDFPPFRDTIKISFANSFPYILF